MNAMKWNDRKIRFAAAAALLLIAGALLIGALTKTKGEEPAGWIRLDAPLAAALAEAENDDGKTGERSAAAAGGLLPGQPDSAAGQRETGNDGAAEETAAGGSMEPAAATATPKAGVPERNDRPADPPAAGNADPGAAGATGSAGSGADNGEPAGGRDGRIDINRATVTELDALPGIGPAKAQAIVADREANGPFRSVDDLLRVKGIGPKMLEKMKESVVAGK